MPVHWYATYFDVQYAARGIAMVESLLRRDPHGRIFVLGIEAQMRSILGQWFGSERIIACSPEAVAQFRPRLPEVQPQRTPWEFYATQKAVFLSFLLPQIPDGDWLVHVDADSYFFADPEPIFSELEGVSVGVSPHRPPVAREAAVNKYGRFNAGFIAARHDAIGRRCLDDWAEDCLDWCFDQVSAPGKYMNQGYLDLWPERYTGVHILEHPGVNLAPWNLESHHYELHGTDLLVDGAPLIHYHFSGVAVWEGKWYAARHRASSALGPLVREGIYRPYREAVEKIGTRLQTGLGFDGIGSVRTMPNREKWVLLLE